MATIKEIIARVDEIRPNGFTERVKLAWVSELEGKIAADVMLMSIDEIRNLEYKYPDDLENEPMVSYPHQEVYVYWLQAQIDYTNGEYNKYQNSMEMYNQHYGNFVRWFANTYAPAQGYPDKPWPAGWEDPPYYLTAYGLAIKGGFRGSLEDWLASLKGEKGDKGDTGTNAYEYAVAGGYDGTEEEFAAVMAEQMKYLEDLVTLNKHLVNFENPHKVSAKQSGALSLLGEEAMKAILKMGGFKITGLAEPTDETDAATKAYADKKLALDGTAPMTGDLPMGGHRVVDVGDPEEDGDAVNLGYAKKVGNPYNLLDNSDFLRFVAQAGIGGTHGTQAYAGDRWILASGTVTGTENPNGNGYSDIVLNGTIKQKVASVPDDPIVGIEMVSGTATISYADGVVSITSEGGTIRGAMLFDGVKILPEYQPKGYGAELAECSRYYERIGYSGNGAPHASMFLCVNTDGDLRPLFNYAVPKRIVPTILLNGVPTGETVSVRNTVTGDSIDGIFSLWNNMSKERINTLRVAGTSVIGAVYEGYVDICADLPI